MLPRLHPAAAQLLACSALLAVPVAGAAGSPQAPTLCLDAAPGSATWQRIEDVFGKGAVESPSDTVYAPPLAHIRQVAADDAAAPYFAFIALEPGDVNLDGKPLAAGGDRSRTEIKLAPSSGPHDAYKAREGDSVTYSWRFRIAPSMRFSPAFTHLHQIKAHGGDFADAPLITFTALENGRFEVRHVGDQLRESRHSVLASAPLARLQGPWLSAEETITYSNTQGHYRLAMRDAAGRLLLEVDRSGLQLWRTGANHMRPKWGIYRKHHPALNQQREDQVDFAALCISAPRR